MSPVKMGSVNLVLCQGGFGCVGSHLFLDRGKMVVLSPLWQCLFASWLLDHRVGVNHLDDERVTAGPRLQLVYLGEHRLPLRPLPLLLPRSRH